jgi:hypothetical protein
MEILKLTIRNNFDRGILGEGRNFGVGFAYVTPTRSNSKRIFKTMQAFSACKDYLNDLIYVERHNKPLAKVHGFKHTYTGFFKNKDFLYLGVKVVHYNCGALWQQFTEASNLFKSQKEHLLTSINKLEDHLSVSDNRTILYGISDTEFVFKIPAIWGQRAWLTSLMTLWIRCFFNITEEDASLPIKKILSTHKNKIFIPADKYLVQTIEPFINRDEYKSLLNTEYDIIHTVPSTIHSFGISSFINQLNLKKNEPKKKIATSSC